MIVKYIIHHSDIEKIPTSEKLLFHINAKFSKIFDFKKITIKNKKDLNKKQVVPSKENTKRKFDISSLKNNK